MPGPTVLAMANVERSQVGVREEGDNHTPYGVWFGFDGVPWCAIFQSWASATAGALYLGAPWRFASTIAARAHARQHGRWRTEPTVGTIAMMEHTPTTGHVGFVVALLRGGYVVTVEGNTNDQGAREGNGVWLRTRHASEWNGYIVLDETDTPAPAPEPQPAPPVPAPVPPGSSTSAPPFPLPAGWYFGPRSGPRQSVSGFYGHGDDLARWQQRMRDRGWKISVDGRYGPQTEGVARAFQAEKRLPVTGRIDPDTWRMGWEAPVT